MSDTPSPLNAAPTFSVPPLKPYKQWRAESGIEDDDIDTLVKYSGYQKVHALKHGEYSEDTERKIQEALIKQAGKRGYFEGKNEQEREGLLSSLVGIPDPDFNTASATVNAAYPSATADDPDSDLATYAKFRDFSKTLPEELSQDQSAEFETLKTEAAAATTRLYEKAKIQKVRAGQTPIVAVTRQDEKGGSYLDFEAGDLGSLTPRQAVAQAIESGDLPAQAAFGALNALEPASGLKINRVQLREIDRVKDIVSGIDRTPEYLGIKDVVSDYADYLANKESGETDAEDDAFAEKTLRNFTNYLDLITDGAEPPKEGAAKQALEELAYDSAIQDKKIKFNDKDLSKNIRFTEGGIPIVHPALLGNSDKFNEALSGNPDITAEQKRLLTNNRKSFLSGNFDHYDKLLSDSPTQGDAWRDYRNKARAASRKDVDILDGYLKNPNNFNEFSARMSGIGSSILDSVGMLVATIPALAGADWAQEYLVDSAKKSSSRRQVAEAFGRPFGIGQDIMEQVAPMVADIGATALLSTAATPAAGAAYLAARQGVGVTGKAVAKSLTAGFLRRGGFTEAGESVAEAAVRLTDVGDLIRKGTTAADAERIIKGYNQTIASKLNIIPPLFLTSANRSAGGMYGSVYNSLPDNLSAEEKHDQALGAALMAGATTGIITTAFSLAGFGGMENVLLRGATTGQLRRAVTAAAGKNAVRDISNTDMSSAIARGVSETFTKLGITRAAAAKRLGIDTASEAAEEGLDEFIQTFVTDAFTGSDTPILEKLQQSMHAALIGGVFGAGIPSAKAAIKQFTPLTSTEAEATMGAQEELFQNISGQLENTGSPLTAKIIKDLLSVGMSQRGAQGTRFARRTRDEAIGLLTAPPTDGDQMLMGPIINERTEGVRPVTGTTAPEEGPPTASPEPAAAEGTPAATDEAGALPATPAASPVSSVRTVEEMREMARGNLGPAAIATPEEPIDFGAALAGVSPDELGEAAEAEMSQGFFDFFDDVASVVSGSPNEEGKTTGSQRTGKKSVDRKPLSPYSSNAEIATLEREVDSLFDSSEAEAESFVNSIQDKGQKKAAKKRLTERGRYAASFGNIKKKAVSKQHTSPTTANTQQAVGESKVAEAAEKSGVAIAYVDGAKDLSRYTGGIPTPKGKTVFTVVSNGIPVVVVDESTVRGKTAAEIAEEMRKAVLHAATLNVAAETGAYTDNAPQDILEEGDLLSKATEADPSIGNASSPAEQLSRVVFAIGDSSLGLNLDNHPKLEAFLKKVLSRLSKNLQGADPDPILDSVIEGNNTLLQDRVASGRAVGSNANTGVPRLNPSTRFDIVDESELTEKQKNDALILGEYLITLRAIPAGVRFIIDFKSEAAFSNKGGFIVVNPTEVLDGLEVYNLVKRVGKRLVITNPKMAKKVLKKELGHEQFHSAVDWALTAEQREAIKNSFTTDELVEQASKYYRNPKQRAEAISALNDPNNPNHAKYRSDVAEEKIRADGETLLEGENSDELLAEISGDEVKRSFYEKYLKRAARVYRKKLNRTGNPEYAAALKRITNAVRDMRLGYIPTQHSHGGIFSLDKPYASIQMLESIFRSLEPMAEGYEDIANDIDATSLDIDEDVATIIGDEGIDLTTLTEGESDSVNFSQFGFSNPETSLAQFKAEAIRVKGMTKAGVTVGTRSPSSTGIKSVSEGGTNPTNRITLEDAAKSPSAFLKNALILTQYPSVRGILSRMLKDPSMVASIKKEKNFTPAQWSDVVDRINRAFSEEVSATFNAPDIFKTSEEYTTATEAREAAIKAVNAEIDKLFFSTAPDGKKEYVTWLFKQIGFTGRGHATPEKQDSSSVKAIREALSSMTEGIAISKTTYPLFTEGYTPPPKTKKWTPSIKDLKEIVKGIRAYEAARNITDANNATTTAKKKTMSGEIEKLSPLILDERSAGVIYDALLTVGRTNLKVLYDIFPKDIVEVARLWYDGANIIARQLSGDTAAQDVGGVRAEAVQPLFGPNGRGLVAKRFGERVLEKASAILAVFSPQKDWLMNVSLAHRAMQVMYDGFTNPSGMVWDARIAARFLARAGQPEIIEEEDGKVKYTGRAVPVVDEAGMPVLDSNGLQTFTNWNEKKAKKATTQAAKINAALKGKTFEQIGVMKLIYSYEDENGKKVTKELDGVALQARFIRMYSEVHHPTDFPVVTPTGEFKGKSLSPKTGAPLKLAWGGYVTIEKAIRIYTSTGSTDTYETDNVLQTISAELGDAHKVRSFYNNIVNPASVDGHVTMDTHAVAALLAKALSGAMAEVSHNFGTSLVGSSKVNGVSGLYAANAEAYRGIAADFDLLARELQSITWESVRILFPPEFKRLKQATDDLNAVWDSFARETPYTPVTVKGQPTPPTITLETLDDVWEQIIRVVWSHTRKGKPVPSLAELRSSAEIDNLPNGTTRRYEDYNGLGFPAWDTRRESMRLLLTEQDKAKETLDDVVEDFLDVSGYLNNPDTLNSSFGQEEGGTNMITRLFKADQNPPVFYSTATIQRAIQNVSTDIVGETTEEILSQALRAKVILAAYGYEGFADAIRDPEVTTLSAYFELKSAKTSTTDPRNGGESGLTYKDAFEPEFMRFFRNAPVLRETIKRNQTGFTLSGDVESQLEGFVVSPRKSTEKFLTEDFTDDELRQYIVDHADILSLPGARLGGWYDPATQRFTLDVSFALTEREDAITIALASDQDAIYDLQNRYDIRTKYIDPDTGESSFVVTRIDGRDPQQVIGEVVPTTGDAAIFASERSVRDKGRMGFASDGGSEAGGAGVTDVGTSRALSEAMEINRAARSGESTQGNFGTVEPLTERTASPATFRTGRFKSIDEKSFLDKVKDISDRGGEHKVWFDQKASNRVFKYAYNFGLTKAINAPNIQAGYVARVAASNILFEDKQRIEYLVYDTPQENAPATGYVISQPFLDSKNRRDLKQEEINATMEALGWRLFLPEGAAVSTTFSSPSIPLPEGGTARIFVYDLHTENAYAETVTDEDGNVVEKFVVLDAPIGIRFPRGTSQEVIDRYPTVAELLAEFPDPASFGIAVPSMLPEIKRAEAASKLFDAIAFSEESSDTLLSQFGYHGTPHKVDKFSTERIGTGEGALAYGWGLYFSESRAVGEGYARNLITKVPIQFDGQEYNPDDPRHRAGISLRVSNGDRSAALAKLEQVDEGAARALRERDEAKIREIGNLYTVELPDADEFLDWDKLAAEQSDTVKGRLKSAGIYSENTPYGTPAKGEYIYHSEDTSLEMKSRRLKDAGIKGIRYLDGNSRADGTGTYNYVIFDENDIQIVEENGKPVTVQDAMLFADHKPPQDAEYLTLAADPVKNQARLQEMVDAAATGAGESTGKVFHWTQSPSVFTSFDPNISKEGFHFGSRSSAMDRSKAFGSEQSPQYEVFLMGNVTPIEDLEVNRPTSVLLQLQERGEVFAPERGVSIWNRVSVAEDKQTLFLDSLNNKPEVRPLVKGFGLFVQGQQIGWYSSKEKASEVADRGVIAVRSDSLKREMETRVATLENILGRPLRSPGEELVSAFPEPPVFTYVNLHEDKGSTSYVVFSPNQIKSADPVTYDESGNVIPLSQRFDSTSDDIRFSQFGNAQDAEYDELEAATPVEGIPEISRGMARLSSSERLYHGSRNPSIESFSGVAYFSRSRSLAENYADAEGARVYEVSVTPSKQLNLWEFPGWVGVVNHLETSGVSAEVVDRVKQGIVKYAYKENFDDPTDRSWSSYVKKQANRIGNSVADFWDPDGFDLSSSADFSEGANFSNKRDLVNALFDAGYDTLGHLEGGYNPFIYAAFIVRDTARITTLSPTPSSPTSDDIRFSQFGFRDSGATLLDQRMGTTSPDNQSMFNDMFDVLEIPILASGTYQKPDSFFARLAMGEFDPRYRKMLQTQRAFNVSAASYIEQERKALIEEVEKAYGSSKDVGANLLISRAFGSTDVTLPEETVAKLRKERRDKLVAAQAAATPEAVEAYVANLMATDSTMDPLDAEIRAKNEIRDAAKKQAEDESEADDIAARQVHRDMVVKAQNSAIRSLERQAPEVLKRIKRIRLFVDEQSRRIKAELKDNADLRVIIDNQLGIYVTRSYRFFSDEGYRDAIRNPENKNYSTYEAERQLARAFFEEQYIEDRTIELMEAEFGLDEEGAKAKAQEEVDGRAANGRRIGEEMMIRWLDSLEGKAPITEATTSPQGKDDLTIRIVANNLKQRKSVPEPLRKLLNEMDEAEGIERMLRTAATVSAIHSNQKTLSNIYKFGRSDKAPENRWLLTKAEIDALPYEEQRGYSMVPSKGSAGVSAVNPLVGMYAPNDLVEALNNLSTKQHIDSQTAASQQTINAMMMGMTQATGVSMAVNVLLSVGHYFRNVLGYTTVAAVTGRPSLMYKSMSSLSRESKFLLPERLRKALDMTDEKYNVERLRLVALNIDNDSVRASTLKDMLSGKTSMEDVQKEIMSLADAAKSATGKALGAIGDSLTQLEQATETFFKIAYFYDTLEMLDNAVAEGTGTINGLPVSAFNNETALYQEAARQTLMVLPSHSQTMPFVTEFTKSGFGLMLAPFLRFKSEMIRTPINNLKLAREEINSGNSVLRARGIARLTGSFVVLTASTALPMLISKVLGGLDDEDDEALRKSMPSYLRDHSFFYFMFNGELKSIDLTYVNPYSGIGDAFNAMYRAAVKGDVLAPAKGIAQFFSQNFLDDQILFGALRAATENRDPTTGLPIYEAGLDTPSEAAIKIFKFVGLEAYGPRVLTDTLKVIEAAKEGETAPGYGVSDIMFNGVMPFRIHTIDPDQQFRRYLFEHRQQYQRAEGGLNELLGRKAIGPDRVEDIYDETVKNKKRANEDLLRTALAFTGEGLGVSSADADTMMRASGVSKTRISQLNNRAMDRAIPSKDFVDKLLDTPEGKARGQILYDYILQQPRYYALDVR